MARDSFIAVTTGVTVIAGVTLYYIWKSYKNKTRLLSAEELDNANWKPVGKVKHVWLYPVKSFGPLEITTAKAKAHGLQDPTSGVMDRNYMVIMSKNNLFVTGRMCPKMVLVKTSVSANGDLTLKYEDENPVVVNAKHRESGKPIDTKVFESRVTGKDCGDEVAGWLSKLLNRDVRLIYTDENSAVQRKVVPNITGEFPLLKSGDGPIFADNNSFLMLTEASVSDIAEKCGKKMTALRFRPNIVVTNDTEDKRCKPIKPYEEDTWKYIRIGSTVIMRNVYPCARCVFTCVDPETGKASKEFVPLKNLKEYRTLRGDAGPLFGINLGNERPGTISEGDTVYVLA